MRKLIIALLLAFICATPITMTNCSLLQEQYEDLHQMDQASFDKFALQVQNMAYVGGKEIAKHIDSYETRNYIVYIIDVALRQDTKEAFLEFIDAMKILPEYHKFIIPALSAALDLIEATTGVSFSLDTHVHPRDLALIRALLKGVQEGIESRDLLTDARN